MDKIRKDTATYPQVADVLQEFGFDVHAILTLVIQAYFGDNRMPPDLDLAFADLGYLE